MKYYLGFLILLDVLLSSCSAPVRLTASWKDQKFPTVKVSKILVLSIGQDLQKRKLAEDKLKSELQKKGFKSVTSLEEFGPDFANTKDTVRARQMLMARQFDGCLTIRVLNVDEHDRWVPGRTYQGPEGFYTRFYWYFYQVYGYYGEPGYIVTDVEVLLESNLYYVASGELLWSGQSKAFSRIPTPEMANRYARIIVKDIIDKRVIVP
jgi:hypothetical protein